MHYIALKTSVWNRQHASGKDPIINYLTPSSFSIHSEHLWSNYTALRNINSMRKGHYLRSHKVFHGIVLSNTKHYPNVKSYCYIFRSDFVSFYKAEQKLFYSEVSLPTLNINTESPEIHGHSFKEELVRMSVGGHKILLSCFPAMQESPWSVFSHLESGKKYDSTFTRSTCKFYFKAKQRENTETSM